MNLTKEKSPATAFMNTIDKQTLEELKKALRLQAIINRVKKSQEVGTPLSKEPLTREEIAEAACQLNEMNMMDEQQIKIQTMASKQSDDQQSRKLQLLFQADQQTQEQE